MAVHPQVAGRWLADICPFGEVSWATSWVGGLDTFSWQIPTIGAFPALRRGVAVELFDGGLSLGQGIITEVTGGEVHGEGLMRFAANAPALDSSGDPSVYLDSVLDEAIARGDLPGWSRPASLGSSLGTAPDTPVSVADLLTAFGDIYGAAWYLNNRGEIGYRTIPTTPTWQATPPDGQLSTASDEYVTRLYATYLSAAGVRSPRSLIDTDAEARWDPKPAQVDLTPLGIITGATADDILVGMLAKGRARPTWAGTLEVAYGEITTLGGTPVKLGTLEAGQGGRVLGTFDDSRLIGGYSYTDITAGKVEYTDGAATAQITPVGSTPRDFKSILTVALEGAA